jgi:hypothetical protein
VVRDAARDVLERGAREGRTRLDDLRSNRRRSEALSELGEVVLELIRRGEIDVAELPEARDIVAHLDELDAAAESDEAAASRDSTPTTPPPTRSRFDDRASPKEDGTVSSGTWTPPARRPGRPTNVWRPKASAEPVPSSDDQPPTSPGHKALPKRDPARKGGIQFDDDSDLADYMHPDDVPPKPRPDE